MSEEEIIHEFEVNMHENDAAPMDATEKICVQNFLNYAIETRRLATIDELYDAYDVIDGLVSVLAEYLILGHGKCKIGKKAPEVALQAIERAIALKKAGAK